jgi:hypothetical protein
MNYGWSRATVEPSAGFLRCEAEKSAVPEIAINLAVRSLAQFLTAPRATELAVLGWIRWR